jgi:RNA polymerase sigma-70 factor, ECF subfamily
LARRCQVSAFEKPNRSPEFTTPEEATFVEREGKLQGGPEIDWKAVVEQIRAGDPAGVEALYRNLNSGARLFLQRRLGTSDVDDRVHEVFLIILGSIQRGELREPERLMGFVRTVLYRQLNLEISRAMRDRESTTTLDLAAYVAGAEPNPEQIAIWDEKLTIMRRLLREMKGRDVEVLTRCYIREQLPEQIMRDMGLTQSQFYLVKSRAKARLSELIDRRFSRGRS